MVSKSQRCVCAQLLQACLTLCNPMGCSPPGSPVHGLLQARMLEWVAISFSRGSSLLNWRLSCLLHWQAGSLLLALHGKPLLYPTCTETAGSEGLRRRDCSPGLPGPRLGSTQRLLETHHRQKQGQPRFTRMFYLLLPFFLTRYN